MGGGGWGAMPPLFYQPLGRATGGEGHKQVSGGAWSEEAAQVQGLGGRGGMGAGPQGEEAACRAEPHFGC